MHPCRPTHIQPTTRRRMYIPPCIRRCHRITLNSTMMCIKRPTLVRMSRVHRPQCRPLHLPQKWCLMMVHMRVIRWLRRRPRKIQITPIGSGSGHWGAGGHDGSAGVGRSWCGGTLRWQRAGGWDAGAWWWGALRTLLPWVEAFPNGGVRKGRGWFIRKLVALRRQHCERCTAKTRVFLEKKKENKISFVCRIKSVKMVWACGCLIQNPSLYKQIKLDFFFGHYWASPFLSCHHFSTTSPLGAIQDDKSA